MTGLRGSNRTWTIGRRLTAGFGLVVAVFVFAMGTALVLSARSQSTWKGTQEWVDATVASGQKVQSALLERNAQANYAATGDKKSLEDFDRADTIGDTADPVIEAIDDEQIQTILAEAQQRDEIHDQTLESEFFPAVERGNRDEIVAGLAKVDALVGTEYEATLKIQSRIDQLRNDDIAKAEDTARLGTIIGVLLCLAGIVAAVFIARRIITGVRRPLESIVAVAEAGANGDLTVRAETGEDEIGRAGAAFNGMVEGLAALVGRITAASSDLAGQSDQLRQASSEAGRAVDEIARALGSVAEGAERQVSMVTVAKTSSDATRQAADEGVDAASEASEAMLTVRETSNEVSAVIGELGAKSAEIGGIVETITGIAEQTNLLALNAAIEAARAGEQGRGFAVVAEEVRKLAEESQRAAGSIANLIGEIQGATERAVRVVVEGAERVERGTETVERTRAAFTAITGAVSAVDDSLLEVSTVAEETSAASQEVSASSEETSATTQEIASAAERLQATAVDLDGLVSRFKV